VEDIEMPTEDQIEKARVNLVNLQGFNDYFERVCAVIGGGHR
jgi:hypothetical protein